MSNYKTEQEQFWAGEFGNEYVNRNAGEKLIASNLALFSKILTRTNSVQSIIEFGANIGMNLLALRQLLPTCDISAIEINQTAVEELKKYGFIKVYPQSILEYEPDTQCDLVFTKGVLIHINPEWLPKVYKAMYESSKKYILVAEYYNPAPVEITYRGHSGKLFKRDFAGDLQTMYPNLQLIDYGFAYHGDPNFPQDDITWFLFEKK